MNNKKIQSKNLCIKKLANSKVFPHIPFYRLSRDKFRKVGIIRLMHGIFHFQFITILYILRACIVSYA